jgi:cytochrome P450
MSSGAKSKEPGTPLPTGIALTTLDPVFRDNPHVYLDRLREEDPVHRDTQLNRYVLTRFEHVAEILRDRSMSADPRKANEGTFHRIIFQFDENFEPSMLTLDDPDHRRIRGLVTQAFNQRAVDAMRPRIKELTNQLLERVVDRPEFDLVDALAAPLPTIVIAEMLGVDPAEQAQFKEWSDTVAVSFNPMMSDDDKRQLVEARDALRGYFARAIEERRGKRGDDLISQLVAIEETGEKLKTSEIISTCILLLTAGNLTTTDLIGNAVVALLKAPDQLGLLKSQPELLNNAIEEVLRYDAPVANSGRVATCPYSMGDKNFQKGESIGVSLVAAGHDPAIHKDPHRFDIARKDTRHVAFGGGAHFCLGAPLARAEAQIALACVFERFPNLRLSGKALERKSIPVFNGWKEIWVRA